MVTSEVEASGQGPGPPTRDRACKKIRHDTYGSEGSSVHVVEPTRKCSFRWNLMPEQMVQLRKNTTAPPSKDDNACKVMDHVSRKYIGQLNCFNPNSDCGDAKLSCLGWAANGTTFQVICRKCHKKWSWTSLLGNEMSVSQALWALAVQANDEELRRDFKAAQRLSEIDIPEDAEASLGSDHSDSSCGNDDATSIFADDAEMQADDPDRCETMSNAIERATATAHEHAIATGHNRSQTTTTTNGKTTTMQEQLMQMLESVTKQMNMHQEALKTLLVEREQVMLRMDEMAASIKKLTDSGMQERRMVYDDRDRNDRDTELSTSPMDTRKSNGRMDAARTRGHLDAVGKGDRDFPTLMEGLQRLSDRRATNRNGREGNEDNTLSGKTYANAAIRGREAAERRRAARIESAKEYMAGHSDLTDEQKTIHAGLMAIPRFAQPVPDGVPIRFVNIRRMSYQLLKKQLTEIGIMKEAVLGMQWRAHVLEMWVHEEYEEDVKRRLTANGAIKVIEWKWHDENNLPILQRRKMDRFELIKKLWSNFRHQNKAMCKHSRTCIKIAVADLEESLRNEYREMESEALVACANTRKEANAIDYDGMELDTRNIARKGKERDNGDGMDVESNTSTIRVNPWNEKMRSGRATTGSSRILPTRQEQPSGFLVDAPDELRPRQKEVTVQAGQTSAKVSTGIGGGYESTSHPSTQNTITDAVGRAEHTTSVYADTVMTIENGAAPGSHPEAAESSASNQC